MRVRVTAAAVNPTDTIVREGWRYDADRSADGVDVLADGAVLDEKALPAVKDGGTVATVRGYQGDGQRDLRVHAVWVRDVAGGVRGRLVLGLT
ncbi:hypothetical protein [Nocardioides deserti]|uniref:Alcohol dehydrogenase catalytic domain-containing protein n=1 Tax=Nocardioides deserti TaxID=1588644 RepID=A0ABR6U700_9ACTN|nr:hypothetical protein [Nocardioides deserti]MBC2960209.1 hypothetical protein [Nocardioides deserti]